ncbi:MAG: hypothetical protein JWP01_1908 [Myxococcales bacterium]|nr:hypothetical protein [Myxococcales bacterium]
MSLDVARAVADAVLVEGYALYPYRASAPKNRFRWAFGVLAPQGWSRAGGCEPWWLEAQVLVAGSLSAQISGELRFFQIERRHIERATLPGFAPVDSLEADGKLLVGWDEGHVQAAAFATDLRSAHAGLVIPFSIDGSNTVELIAGGRILRERQELVGVIVIHAEPIGVERALTRLTIRVENTTPWQDLAAPRHQAITAAFASTHLLLETTGEFLSLLDPPDWARAAAEACRNTGTYPVLAGPPGTNDVVLSAPFILYDHPQLAPESPTDLFDATENDELLTLRTLTLTDDEKRQARATDPRTAAVIDGVEQLPPEWFERLHGTARDVVDGEMVPRSIEYAPGCRVRLRPGKRRTDAQDLLYAGKLATVAEIRHDVDGSIFLAVTIDDDPAAELHDWYGRYHHYRTDEVELVEPAPEPTP